MTKMMTMRVERWANPSYGAVRLKLWPQWHNLRTTFGGFMMMFMKMLMMMMTIMTLILQDYDDDGDDDG